MIYQFVTYDLPVVIYDLQFVSYDLHLLKKRFFLQKKRLCIFGGAGRVLAYDLPTIGAKTITRTKKILEN